MSEIIKDRRIGRFYVSVELIDEAAENLKKLIFSQVIVLEAKSHVYNDTIEYIALCDAFAPIPKGGMIRTYTPLLRKEDDGTVMLQEWQ